VLRVLLDQENPYELRAFDTPAHSASQAAELLNCPLGAIVKSLVFQKQASGELFMVLVSGKNRADTEKLSQVVSELVQTAKPKTVHAMTGYPVGAVPPFGFKASLPTIMDVDLLDYEHVWASAGAENMLMQLNPKVLQHLTQAQVDLIS